MVIHNSHAPICLGAVAVGFCADCSKDENNMENWIQRHHDVMINGCNPVITEINPDEAHLLRAKVDVATMLLKKEHSLIDHVEWLDILLEIFDELDVASVLDS